MKKSNKSGGRKRNDSNQLKIDELLHNLIFSGENTFQLDISDYIDDYYNYEEFMDDIKMKMILSKVYITDNKISVNSDGVIWKLKVKR